MTNELDGAAQDNQSVTCICGHKGESCKGVGDCDPEIPHCAECGRDV